MELGGRAGLSEAVMGKLGVLNMGTVKRYQVGA